MGIILGYMYLFSETVLNLTIGPGHMIVWDCNCSMGHTYTKGQSLSVLVLVGLQVWFSSAEYMPTLFFGFSFCLNVVVKRNI